MNIYITKTDTAEEKETKRIQEAIDECHEKGGGVVTLDQGIWVSGTLFVRSNVTLEIPAGSVLLASPDIADYSDKVHHNRYRNEKSLDRCFLYAEDAENIGIRGEGEIRGNSEAFPNAGSIYRPMMLRFLRCCNVHITQVRLTDAAAWTTAFLDSKDIYISQVTIFNEKRYNGDGLDFDGCRNVYVSDCSITGTDDNLCLQASSREYPVENIHITNCSFSSVCAGIRIGLKSIGSISNVVISNCTMQRVWREGIKLECTEGGSIRDISISNILMNDVSRPIFMILNNRFTKEGYGSSVELNEMPKIGEMKRIRIMGLTAIDTKEMEHAHYRFGKDIMGSPLFNGIRIDAAKEHPIEEIFLSQISYYTIGGVKETEVPAGYPEVLDKRLFPEAVCSENYYPDWSRTTFADIRNVNGLSLEGITFFAERKDEREGVRIENCRIYKKEIQIKACK